MSATIRWRTTSAWPRCTKPSPSMPVRIGSRPDEAAAAAGDVDLGGVAGDHDLRAEPDAGQEHLHLLRRRVLRLVEDDEAVVERAAAHERERRDLDGLAFEQLLCPLGIDHVVQARRTAGAGTGRSWPSGRRGGSRAARRPRPPGRVRMMRCTCLACSAWTASGHRQPALAGAGRTEPERDHVVADGIDVALLPGRLGTHGFAPRPPAAPRR